ncbi:MAG: M15 family metallopeptidase [Bacteroidales bacterium]|nr:M15 family metallopeptidase [Bacteroidales bacterium]
MKKFLIIILIFVSCTIAQTNNGSVAKDTLVVQNNDTIPWGAKKLILSYPALNLKYADNHIIFPDGEKIVYDDGRKKTFIEQLDDCDIEDMFSMEYDTVSMPPKYLNDCGRGRSEQFFKKVYGKSAAEVSANLEKVNWFSQQIPMTKINGVSDTLKIIAKELAQKPHLKKYFEKSSSFYWRQVRGAKRLSAHSYGIAIDINVANSTYWLWANKNKSETDSIKYANKIPLEIVKIFEKHGFIWGGRWYHYDTMHFEYRPELM